MCTGISWSAGISAELELCVLPEITQCLIRQCAHPATLRTLFTKLCELLIFSMRMLRMYKAHFCKQFSAVALCVFVSANARHLGGWFLAFSGEIIREHKLETTARCSHGPKKLCNYRGEIMWKKWRRKNREGRKGEKEVVKEEDRNRERERETTEAKYWLEYIWENNSVNEKTRVVWRIYAVWKTTVNLRCVLKVHLSAAQPTFKTVRSMYGLHNSGLSSSSVRYVRSKAAGETFFPAVWWSWCSNLCSSGLACRVNKTMLACLMCRESKSYENIS